MRNISIIALNIVYRYLYFALPISCCFIYLLSYFYENISVINQVAAVSELLSFFISLMYSQNERYTNDICS